MSTDVVRRKLLAGLSELKVVDLLGTPESVMTQAGPCGRPLPHVRSLAYFLGHPSLHTGRGWDDAYLLVHFDQNGTCVATEITGC